MADQSTSPPGSNRRQMVVIGVAALALALVLSLVWYLVLYTPYSAAFTQLKADDASLIVDELKKQKTPFELADSGATIKVPQDQVDAVRLAILGGGLPLKGTVGFELFNKSDMGLTEFAQKINYQRALQGELARTLMTLANIDSARVHITLPDDGVFRDDRRPAKASVSLSPKLGKTVDSRTIIGIQRLIASAVEGLDAMNVVVLDEAGRQLSGEITPPMPDLPDGAGQNPLQLGWADNIRRAIGAIVQDPQMRVVVATPPGTAAAATAPGTPAAQQHRGYPVQITVLLSREPEAGLKSRILPVLQTQLGFGDNAGDIFDLVAQPGASPFEVGQPIATTSGKALPGIDENVGVQVELAKAGMIALAALAVILFVIAALRRRGSKPLSPSEREAFASRLRDLLAEGANRGRA